MGGDRELAAVVSRHLRNGDLLIMGCGCSAVLAELQTSGFRCALGVDLSEEAIRLASRFVAPNTSFQVGDMTTFEGTQPYDVILFSESLYYVPSHAQEPLLRRLATGLKHGGVFIVTLAQPKRYLAILTMIRENFTTIEDSAFPGSSRHVIVFHAEPASASKAGEST
jgi:trans-aconitate methyltransferase